MAAAVPVVGAAALLAVDIAETVLIQIVGQLVAGVMGAALAPEFDALQGASFTLTPGRRLSPDQAAVAQVKGHLAPAVAADEARFAGIAGDRFATMVAAAGNPPPADFLLQLARRGIIPIADGKGADSISAEQGIRESFLHNKWISVMEQGQWALPGLGALIEARLRNFITPAEFNNWTHQLGYKDDAAGLEFKAAGVPLSPGEGYEAYHRGLIPLDSPDPNVVSLKQVFRESRLIDKYVDVWVGLNEYIPPPRTVTAMLREGALTDAQALKFYKDAGLSEETTAAYLEAAHHQRVAATKELSKATILALYKDKLIDAAQASAALVKEGWAETSAAYELEVADFTSEKAQLDQVLSRLRALYVAHKLDKQATANALDTLGLTPAARDHQLSFWDQARANNVSILTAAQIASLVKLEWLSFAAGVNLLEGHGYSNPDAQLFILEHLKLKPTDSLPPGATVGGQ